METDDNRGNEVVSNDNNNSFKLLLYYIFPEERKYMTILGAVKLTIIFVFSTFLSVELPYPYKIQVSYFHIIILC